MEWVSGGCQEGFLHQVGVLLQEAEEGGGGTAGAAGAGFPLGEGAHGNAQGGRKLGLGEAEAAAQGADAVGGVCFHAYEMEG